MDVEVMPDFGGGAAGGRGGDAGFGGGAAGGAGSAPNRDQLSGFLGMPSDQGNTAWQSRSLE